MAIYRTVRQAAKVCTVLLNDAWRKVTPRQKGEELE